MSTEPVPSPYHCFSAPICFSLWEPLPLDTVYSPANTRIAPRAGDLVLGDLLPGPYSLDPETAVLREDLRLSIARAFEVLDARERKILELRFGFDGEPLTLEEIGRQFGLTRERIRQIEAKAVRKLAGPRSRHLLEPFRYAQEGRPQRSWPPAPPWRTANGADRNRPRTNDAPNLAAVRANRQTPRLEDPAGPKGAVRPSRLPDAPPTRPAVMPALPAAARRVSANPELPPTPRSEAPARAAIAGDAAKPQQLPLVSVQAWGPSESGTQSAQPTLPAGGLAPGEVGSGRLDACEPPTEPETHSPTSPSLPRRDGISGTSLVREAPRGADIPGRVLDSVQMTAAPADIERYRRNLRDEIDGIALYRALAAAEKDSNLREVFSRLADSEERHRAYWEAKLREAGAEVPRYRPSWRVRLLGWLARRFGTASVSPIVTRMEISAYTTYDDQPDAIEANLPRDERSHARLFRELARSNRGRAPQVDIARLEGRHRAATGNALRAAVLGANDGLVSNLSLVMGVAGAEPGNDVVLLAGIAGLLAGSLSMALGEWISVRSSAEAFARQLEIEREEIAAMPDEELEELVLIYRAKGLPEDEARLTATRIIANHEQALDTLAREELGMSEEEAGNPWVAAITSFLTFSAGAIIPVLPWLVLAGSSGIAASLASSAVGLFAVGAAITLYTGKSVLYSGFRMLLFGLLASAITFGIGRIIGVSTGI